MRKLLQKHAQQTTTVQHHPTKSIHRLLPTMCTCFSTLPSSAQNAAAVPVQKLLNGSWLALFCCAAMYIILAPDTGLISSLRPYQHSDSVIGLPYSSSSNAAPAALKASPGCSSYSSHDCCRSVNWHSGSGDRADSMMMLSLSLLGVITSGWRLSLKATAETDDVDGTGRGSDCMRRCGDRMGAGGNLVDGLHCAGDCGEAGEEDMELSEEEEEANGEKKEPEEED